jgi:O-antigen biosynthesis protein
VFAWTDEWWRGGQTVDDWAFGLVDAQRQTLKPALHAVSRVFAEAPFSEQDRANWPTVTVAICAYNAADTIGECLASVQRSTYPAAEILVINDGSRDGTGDIARQFPGVRVIDVPNGGLSAARNIALQQASGEIIAYTDADVRVDADWLTYLIQPFVNSKAAAAGGPNIVPADDPWMAQCVARSPGSPTHVLLNDQIAEHVPGCNMAFRRNVLLEIGGFNPIFARAGDDVDVCWRVQRQGYRIAFAPSALVWHRHRQSVRAYWKQQVGYGEGESWLMDRYPEKFAGDRPLWTGRIYSPIPFLRSLWPVHVHTGRWGTALFPSVYRKAVHPLAYLPHRFRWQVLSLMLLVFGGLALSVTSTVPGLILAVGGVTGVATTLIRCMSFASRSDLDRLPPIGFCPRRFNRLLYTLVIGFLHYLQPFARAAGRLRGESALGGWALRIPGRWTAPRSSFADFLTSVRLLLGFRHERRFWSESWLGADTLLSRITERMHDAQTFRAIEVDDGWHGDRDIRAGVPGIGAVDLRVLVEEHAGGRCLARVSVLLRIAALTSLSPFALIALAALGLLVARLPSVVELAIAATTMPVIFCLMAWHVSRTAGVLRRIVQEVAGDLGLFPMGSKRPRRNLGTHERAGVPLVTHEQQHES